MSDLKDNLSSKFIILSYSILIALIIFAYYPMFDNFFYSDDFEHIGLILDNFSNIKTLFSSYHLSTGFLHLSNFLNIFFFGVNPISFQITNLVFHLFNVVLVGLVITLLTKNEVFGFLGAFYWGLNDKYTEVVLELFQRGRSMLFFEILLVLVFLIMYFKNNKMIYYFLSIVVYLSGIFTHWDFVVMAPIVLSYIFVFHGFNRKSFLKSMPFAFIFMIYIFIQVLLKNASIARSYYDLSWNFLGRLSQNIFDIFELYNHSYGSKIFGITFILLIIVTFIFNKDKIIRFGLLFFVFSIYPTIMVRFQNSRYMYIPIFGITLILIKLLDNFIQFCNGRELRLLKYGVPVTLGIIFFTLHFYGIRIDEHYRDYRGRIEKDVYANFKNMLPEIKKDVPVVFVDFETKAFYLISFAYYSRYPERFSSKRPVYRYCRGNGVMGLISLKDLVLMAGFEEGKILKWRPIPNWKSDSKNYQVLVFKDNKFRLEKNVPKNISIKDIGVIRDKT